MAEDKKPGFTSFRVSTELYDRMASLAELLPGMSANSFAVQCIEAILTMAQTPKEQRITPALVTMLDVVRKPEPLSDHRRTLELNETPISTRLLKKAKETTK
jgi:hypothetical protein